MKKILMGFMAGVLFTGGLSWAWAATYTDIQFFGYGGSTFAREWVDSSNRISQQAMQDNKSTAYNLWPTAGVRPVTDSLDEITFERYRWDESCMERFNISAMNDFSENGAYRFGVEASPGCQFRGIIFCFETSNGPSVRGGATCPFKITINGVFASSDGGATYHQL